MSEQVIQSAIPDTGEVEASSSAIGRVLAFIYGTLCYLVFFVTFLYAIGFVGNILVPKSIDSGVEAPVEQALIINVVLLGLFAVQHSLMARPFFKRWWTKLVPRAVERSTYVLFASSALLLLYWQWRPLPQTVWAIENEIGRALVYGLFFVGWGIVFLGTFMINHFDLFGLRQVYLYIRSKEYKELGFRTPFFYRFLRHPIMLGFIIAFWSAPVMTVGHLLFAVATTAYILIAIQLEEHDLKDYFGERYREYHRRTPMLIPRPPRH
jgi:protein-S-isoprenylcysteine O-methyltransferase Ste14